MKVIFIIGLQGNNFQSFISPILNKPNILKDRLNEIFDPDYNKMDFERFLLFYIFYINRKFSPSFKRNLFLLGRIFSKTNDEFIDILYMKFVINWMIQNQNIPAFATSYQIKDLLNIELNLEELIKESKSRFIDIETFNKYWIGKEHLVNYVINFILY